MGFGGVVVTALAITSFVEDPRGLEVTRVGGTVTIKDYVEHGIVDTDEWEAVTNGDFQNPAHWVVRRKPGPNDELYQPVEPAIIRDVQHIKAGKHE